MATRKKSRIELVPELADQLQAVLDSVADFTPTPTVPFPSFMPDRTPTHDVAAVLAGRMPVAICWPDPSDLFCAMLAACSDQHNDTAYLHFSRQARCDGIQRRLKYPCHKRHKLPGILCGRPRSIHSLSCLLSALDRPQKPPPDRRTKWHQAPRSHYQTALRLLGWTNSYLDRLHMMPHSPISLINSEPVYPWCFSDATPWPFLPVPGGSD